MGSPDRVYGLGRRVYQTGNLKNLAGIDWACTYQGHFIPITFLRFRWVPCLAGSYYSPVHVYAGAECPGCLGG